MYTCVAYWVHLVLLEVFVFRAGHLRLDSSTLGDNWFFLPQKPLITCDSSSKFWLCKTCPICVGMPPGVMLVSFMWSYCWDFLTWQRLCHFQKTLSSSRCPGPGLLKSTLPVFHSVSWDVLCRDCIVDKKRVTWEKQGEGGRTFK